MDTIRLKAISIDMEDVFGIDEEGQAWQLIEADEQYEEYWERVSMSNVKREQPDWSEKKGERQKEAEIHRQWAEQRWAKEEEEEEEAIRQERKDNRTIKNIISEWWND